MGTPTGDGGQLASLGALSPEERRDRLAGGSPDLALVALGDELEALAASDLAAAAQTIEWLIPLADDLGTPSSRARVRRSAALTLTYAGHPEAALTVCLEGRGVARDGGDPVEAARATLAAVHPLAMLGRFDEAIELALAARAALSLSGRIDLAVRADLNLGAIYAMLERVPEAVATFDRARPNLEHEPSLLAQLESNAGVALIGVGRFDEASGALERAAAAFESAGQSISAATARGNLAHLLVRRGRLAEGIALYERVDDEFRLTSAAAGQQARIQAEEAAALVEVGLAAEADALASRSIPGLDAAGMALDAAIALLTVGTARAGLGDIPAAAEAARDASARLSAIGNEPAAARADVILARLLSASDSTGARVILERRRQARVGRPVDELDEALISADLALSRDDLDHAAVEIARARAAAGRIAYLPGRAEALHLAGRLRRARGESALWPLRGAVAAAERLRSAFRASALQGAVQARFLAPYLDLIHEAVVRGEPQEAFRVAELCKQRQLTLTLAPTAALDPGRIVDEESRDPYRRHLAEQLSWLYADVAQAGLGGERVDPSTLARIASLERELATIDRRTDAARLPTPGDGDGMAHSAPVHLPEGTVGLSFVVLPDAVVGLVARPGTPEPLRSVVAPVEPVYLDRLLGGLRFQLSRALMLPERAGDDRLIAGFNRVSAALYDLLLRPIESLIPDGAHVVISPHAGLHAVPYTALWDGARYAGERWTLSVLPNLSMAARLADLPPRPGAPLIVGVWDEQAPGIATEVAAVGAELPMANTLLGEEATVAGVSGAVGLASDLHVACHGHFSTHAPRSAGLRMTDGWLTVSAIQRLPIRGAHVTLSGCDTGAATHSALDDAVGVPAALLNGGVASMLVSHWPAHDDASTLLMTAWYRARGTGAAPARALAVAQSVTRKQFPHPALWSAFYVGGIG